MSVTVDVLGKKGAAPTVIDVGVTRGRTAPTTIEVGVSRTMRAPMLIEVLIPSVTGVLILDRHRQVKATLPGVAWHYTRAPNETTEITIRAQREILEHNIPPGHDLYSYFTQKRSKLHHAELAAFVQITQSGRLIASGRIANRTLGQITTISAFTEEILLEANRTPAQYGKVWDGWDLADVVRDNLDGWHTLRVKAKEQWQSRMVASSNVDLDTDPGVVMLTKTSAGQYHSDGYITLYFDPSEVANFKKWDRIRWSADSDGSMLVGEEEPTVQTTVQWSVDGTNFSAPFDGGLPEEVGLVPGETSGGLWARINLHTNDTESEDVHGDPVGVTPYVFACELIARTQGELVPGNIPASAGVTVTGLNADHSTSLAVIQSACAQVSWEFNVLDGFVNLAEAFGVDRTDNVLLRQGTNMEITTLGDDDEDLVNILTAHGPGRGINRLEITLRDEESIAKYGPYPNRGRVEFDVSTLAELQIKAQEYLDTHNTPVESFSITALHPENHHPEYGLGDTVRVVDPDTGIVTTTRIMGEQRAHDDSGLSVHLELGKAGVDITSIVGGRADKQLPSPPLPRSAWARGIAGGIMVWFSSTPEDWDHTECHVSDQADFEPGENTLAERGKKNRFVITGLEVGTTHYAKLVHVDVHGRRSNPSATVSAVPLQMTNIPIELDTTDGGKVRVDMLGMVLADPDNIESRYAARMVAGTASDGDVVPLNFGYIPKVIIAPTAFFAGGEGATQEIEAVDVRRDRFTVYSKLLVAGAGSSPSVNQNLSLNGTWISPATPFDIGRLGVTIELYLSAEFKNVAYSNWTPTWVVEYRLGSGSWATLGTFSEALRVERTTTGIITAWRRSRLTILRQHTLDVPLGVYQIRVRFVSQNTSSGGNYRGITRRFTVKSWNYADVQILGSGADVAYFAIEGGA